MKQNDKNYLYILILLMGSIFVSSSSLGHGGMTGIVKERHDKMVQLSNQLKIIKKYLKEDQGTLNDVQLSAQKISTLAMDMHRWFPKGSSMEELQQNPNGARKSIWENFDEFTEMANRLKIQSDIMMELSANGAQHEKIIEQYSNIGRVGCMACHKKFREKL